MKLKILRRGDKSVNLFHMAKTGGTLLALSVLAGCTAATHIDTSKAANYVSEPKRLFVAISVTHGFSKKEESFEQILARSLMGCGAAVEVTTRAAPPANSLALDGNKTEAAQQQAEILRIRQFKADTLLTMAETSATQNNGLVRIEYLLELTDLSSKRSVWKARVNLSRPGAYDALQVLANDIVGRMAQDGIFHTCSQSAVHNAEAPPNPKDASILTPIEAPSHDAPPSATLKPFAPLPEPDLSKIPPPPQGSTITVSALNEITANSPKGVLLSKLAPVPPIPANIDVATPGIELRLSISEHPNGDYKGFIQVRQRPEDPAARVLTFTRIFEREGRLSACGFFVREPSTSNLTGVVDRFLDSRSYLDIGGLARLPANYMSDATAVFARGPATDMETVIQQPALTSKIAATCVTSNIAWDARFATAMLTLHIQDQPLRFQWVEKRSFMRPDAGGGDKTPKK